MDSLEDLTLERTDSSLTRTRPPRILGTVFSHGGHLSRMDLLRKIKGSKRVSSNTISSMEGRSQPLSVKDAQSFQKALTLYESKDYEKSLSEVNDILKRRKEKIHGESLCLKGLLLHHLNREPDEAEMLISQGCEVDSKSHVAWHMAGIYHKLKAQYPLAYRDYLKSYRLKRDNPNVHQDLAMLAAQQRDYATLVEVRRQILGTKMSLRMAWTGLAAAQFLNGDYTGVEQTVMLYEQIMGVEKASKPKKEQNLLGDEIEVSELLMLRNRAILAQQQYERAVEDLDKIEPRVRDKLAWQESKALVLANYDKKAAKAEYLKLLDRNPENSSYYEALERIVEDRQKLYDELVARFPQADMPRARPLEVFDVSQYDNYQDRLEEYLRTKLKRQVPSTFMLVKPLYANLQKRDIITEVVESKLNMFQEHKGQQQAATVVFAARHLSHTGEPTKAVDLLESLDVSAFDEDMKVDVELALAELYHNAGGFNNAVNILSTASDKIPGDRYLNTRAAAAAFRADNVDEGYKLAYRFPIWGKHAKTDQEALQHLFMMESVNVFILAAESHHRRREHGLALKRATQAIDLIHAYYREQYDFHFYGPRRGSLRAYIDLLSWEDKLYTHPVYARAVQVAVAEWVSFSNKESDGLTERELSNMKRRRANLLETLDTKEDKDPFGISLLESSSGLQQAFDAWKYLESAEPSRPETWWLSFELYLAQEKYVLANQALKKAREFGLSASKLAAGGLMARHTLENDSKAPQVLRSLQLKMLPSIATEGDIVNTDPIEYANRYVTYLVDWLRVRRYMNSMDGVVVQAISRIDELKTVDEVQQAFLELQKAGFGAEFAEVVKRVWPKATFC